MTIGTTPIAAADRKVSLLAWYREMSTGQRRTFWGCYGGHALDAMDTQLYSWVLPALLSQWSLTKGQAGEIGTAALLSSAIGGWAAGILADRIGRVRTLQITILWFASFSFLSGLAENYSQLFAARALLGFGFGGETAASAVLIGEIIDARHRGKGVGLVQSGWSLGSMLAAGVATLFFSVLPEAQAWRAVFFVGLLPAVLVFVIRRYVAEPQVFKESRQRTASGGREASFLAIFSRPMLKTTILTALISTGSLGGNYTLSIWLPAFLKTVRGLSVLNTGGFLAVMICGAFTGYVVGSYLTDRIGRRKHFVVFALGSLVTVYAYTLIPISNTVMLFLGFPLGFFSSGIFAAIGAYFTELFPTPIRASGQGFAFNFGRGVGALFPMLVGYLGATLPLGTAIGVFALVAYAMVLAALLFLPETRGRVLTAEA
jgi:MFS family permease